MRRPQRQSSPVPETDWEAIAATEITTQTTPWKRWKIENARNHLAYGKTRVTEFQTTHRRGVPLPRGTIPEVYLPIGWNCADVKAMNQPELSSPNTLARTSGRTENTGANRPILVRTATGRSSSRTRRSKPRGRIDKRGDPNGKKNGGPADRGDTRRN